MKHRSIEYIREKFEGKSLEERRKLFWQWNKEASFTPKEFWLVIETFFNDKKDE